MQCARTFDAPSRLLSTKCNGNAFVHVALARSPFVLMKHDQEGASLTELPVVIITPMQTPLLFSQENNAQI